MSDWFETNWACVIDDSGYSTNAYEWHGWTIYFEPVDWLDSYWENGEHRTGEPIEWIHTLITPAGERLVFDRLCEAVQYAEKHEAEK
jgi:hypothetical protein